MGIKGALLKKLVDLDKRTITTICRRPRTAEEYSLQTHNKGDRRVAIVMQGPLDVKDAFTIETVKIYKYLFPECKIIVSTWKNENFSQIKRIEEAGAIVVLSDDPEIPGIAHLNHQMISTMNGVTKAKELGCQYVLKTRNDQRFYAPTTIEFLLALYHMIPLRINADAHGRIICTSLDAIQGGLYNMPDHFLFGHIDDIAQYFTCDLDTRTKRIEHFESQKDAAIAAQGGSSHFCQNYIRNCGFVIDYTKRQSFELSKELYIVIDYESIALYWHKYGYYNEHPYKSYKKLKDEEHMVYTFSDWVLNQAREINEEI